MEKICTNCHLPKVLDSFSADKRSKDGRQARCRKCYSEWQRLYNKTGKAPYSVKRSMPKGKNSARWKGGRFVDGRTGYIWININGKQMHEHRHIMEKFLGRKLKSIECVHHKDGNKSNNQIGNLEVMGNSEHVSHHLFERHAAAKPRFSECHPDRKHFAFGNCKKCYYKIYTNKQRKK